MNDSTTHLPTPRTLPAGYHQSFRLMASLPAHPHEVLAQFAHAPMRTIRFAP